MDIKLNDVKLYQSMNSFFLDVKENLEKTNNLNLGTVTLIILRNTDFK